jgi:hypothetical protein
MDEDFGKAAVIGEADLSGDGTVPISGDLKPPEVQFRSLASSLHDLTQIGVDASLVSLARRFQPR